MIGSNLEEEMEIPATIHHATINPFDKNLIPIHQPKLVTKDSEINKVEKRLHPKQMRV